MLEERIAATLNKFPEAGQQSLKEIMLADSFAGVITAQQSRDLATEMGTSIENLMLALVLVARGYAYTPISNYDVGSVVRGASGDLIMGANVEFPGMILNMTVHGEQAAVLQTFQQGESGIEAIAINGTPCGHCRQFLAEINDPSLQLLTPQRGLHPLSNALPDAFMPKALGNESGLLQSIDNGLEMKGNNEDILLTTAFRSAQRSYAPYSKNYAGIALELADGTIFSGSYIESVAFNPSVSPIQAALVTMQMSKRPWQEIKKAILIESKDSFCSQEPVTKALLATLGNVSLQVIPA